MRWVLLILLILVVFQVAILAVAAGWAALLYWIVPDLGVGPAYIAGLISTFVALYLFVGCVRAMGFRPSPLLINSAPEEDEDEEYEDEDDEDDGPDDVTDEEADEMLRRVYLDLTPAMRRKLRARRP